MDRVRRWGDLLDNVLLGVTARLPCRADRVRMACVNKQWRAAVRAEPRPPPPMPQLPPLPPQLPWLIFPNTTTPSFYSWIGGMSHSLPLPPDVRVARFCGSSDGGWFVLALDPSHRYALYNLNSGHRVELPPGIESPSGKQFPLVARFATLSASPSSPSPRPFMLAAVVLVSRRLDVAFWVQGSECWFPHRGPRMTQPQDVIYHNGGFYFVTADEGVVVYWPGYGRPTNNQMRMRRVEYDMLQREDYLEDMGFIGGNGSITRYLVESRGQLLMVARYIYNEGGTEVLRVFRFHVMSLPWTATAAISGRPRATWVPVDYLEGRMLFVGKGCSRSFEAARFDGFEDAIIYFLDEGFVPDTTAVVVQERPRYSFADMGRFRYEMDDMASEAWPPVDRRPTTSDNAPPTWWFP
uniref:KIB1-4 beta-propeller domain-containing protein n=1 Tax=Oryza punctata TaxID=4537 RepID=A0A0E0JKG8_ORYPU